MYETEQQKTRIALEWRITGHPDSAPILHSLSFDAQIVTSQTLITNKELLFFTHRPINKS